MIFLKVVWFSCFEGPVVWSFESNDRKFGPISCNRFPDGSGYRSDRCIAKGDWFLGLLFFFWSLDRCVGVFVISEGVYSVFGADVSKHEVNPFGVILLANFFVFPVVDESHDGRKRVSGEVSGWYWEACC